MIYWNPDRFFTIPLLGWKMSWYFFFWDVGFLLAFFLCIYQFYRYQLNDPYFLKTDLKKGFESQQALLDQLNAEIKKVQDKEGVDEKYLGYEVVDVAKILKRKELEKRYSKKIFSLPARSVKFSIVVFCLIIFLVFLGARVVHMISYEHPFVYIKAPWKLFYFWRGGRASHGGIIGTCLAVWLFLKWAQPKLPFLTWIKAMDIWSPSILLGCAFIRLGNFFTQEILGKETSMPWGMVYGHPVDGSIPMPLHPVQLYEAIAYFSIVVFLLSLSRQLKFMLGEGKLCGLGFVLGFTARFFLEFFKQEQSHIMDPSAIFTMGQILSVPFVIFGFAIYYKNEILLLLKEKVLVFKKRAED